MKRLVDTVRAVGLDLDGTLVDTVPDLASAANAMLEGMALAPLPEQRVAAMVGEGVDALVARLLAHHGIVADQARLQAASDLFRRLYRERLFERSRVYPGVVEGLQALASERLSLCCITNKPSSFTRPLLAAAGLLPLLNAVHCADRPEWRKPAPTLLDAACASFGIEPTRLLYVGDSHLDVAAARAAGCHVALVDYGYSRGHRLADLDADWIVANIADIVGLAATQGRRHSGSAC